MPTGRKRDATDIRIFEDVENNLYLVLIGVKFQWAVARARRMI
jgi:hypothetical protein